MIEGDCGRGPAGSPAYKGLWGSHSRCRGCWIVDEGKFDSDTGRYGWVHQEVGLVP